MVWPHAGSWGGDALVTDAGVALRQGAPVAVYVAGSATAATLYSDRNRTGPASNPVAVGPLGNVVIFAEPGVYELDAGYGRVRAVVMPDVVDLGIGAPGGPIMAEDVTDAAGTLEPDAPERPLSDTIGAIGEAIIAQGGELVNLQGLIGPLASVDTLLASDSGALTGTTDGPGSAGHVAITDVDPGIGVLLHFPAVGDDDVVISARVTSWGGTEAIMFAAGDLSEQQAMFGGFNANGSVSGDPSGGVGENRFVKADGQDLAVWFRGGLGLLVLYVDGAEVYRAHQPPLTVPAIEVALTWPDGSPTFGTVAVSRRTPASLSDVSLTGPTFPGGLVLSYTPANPAYWNGTPPATDREALDRLAAAVSDSGATPVP